MNAQDTDKVGGSNGHTGQVKGHVKVSERRHSTLGDGLPYVERQ